MNMLWWQFCNDLEINAVSLEMGTISFSGEMTVPSSPGQVFQPPHYPIQDLLFDFCFSSVILVSFVHRDPVSIDGIDSTPTQITG